jgi:CheY-like chemotaxis protein
MKVVHKLTPVMERNLLLPKFVLITASASLMKQREEFMVKGADMVVPKPYSNNQINAVV